MVVVIWTFHVKLFEQQPHLATRTTSITTTEDRPTDQPAKQPAEKLSEQQLPTNEHNSNNSGQKEQTEQRVFQGKACQAYNKEK